MLNPITVLSLFNGMSTGRTALDNIGVPIKKYYSSEIKPHALKLTKHLYPDIIELGDVTKWRDWDIDWGSIDLLLSGSPCQDLSLAGSKKGIHGEKSKLFWVFIDILNHIKEHNPRVVFLQENVASASSKDIGIMSHAMNIAPCRINSSLLTAQKRDRLYWTNGRVRSTLFYSITDIPLPQDKKIHFNDIIQGEYEFVDKDKSGTLLSSHAKTFGYKCTDKFTNFIKRRIESRKQVCDFVYVLNNKSLPILESECRIDKGESLEKRVMKQFRNAVFKENNENIFLRPLNKVELCRLQGFPDNHCDLISRNQAASLLGDGWTLPVIEHIFKFIIPTIIKNQTNERKYTTLRGSCSRSEDS